MYRNKIIDEMKLVFKDAPYGIEHTLRVLQNADEIVTGESLDQKTMEIISLSAILHDIGALKAHRKYNSMEGQFQEIEGPPIAQKILEHVGISNQVVDRVCFLVGNHHTPLRIDGLDFQILWEADFLNDLEFGEGSKTREQLHIEIQENFQTATGRSLALKRCGLT